MAVRMSNQCWQNTQPRPVDVDVSGDQGKRSEEKLDFTPEGLGPFQLAFRDTLKGTPEMPFVVRKCHYDERAARHPGRRLGEMPKPGEPGAG